MLRRLRQTLPATSSHAPKSGNPAVFVLSEKRALSQGSTRSNESALLLDVSSASIDRRALVRKDSNDGKGLLLEASSRSIGCPSSSRRVVVRRDSLDASSTSIGRNSSLTFLFRKDGNDGKEMDACSMSNRGSTRGSIRKSHVRKDSTDGRDIPILPDPKSLLRIASAPASAPASPLQLRRSSHHSPRQKQRRRVKRPPTQ